MAMFKCESCGRFYPEPWCDKDQRSLSTVVPDADIPRDAMAEAIARNTAQLGPAPARTTIPQKAKPQAGPRPAPAAAPKAAPAAGPKPAQSTPSPQPAAARDPGPRPAPSARPAASQTQETADEAEVIPQSQVKKIVGLDQFVGMLNSGRKAIVICGTGQSGKSEIANAFIRAMAVYRGRSEVRTLRTQSTNPYVLGGTNPDEVWFQPAGEHHVFLDPYGEFYSWLAPGYRQQLNLPDFTDEDFNFLRAAINRLAGLVLVFDLTKVASDADHSMWQQQEDDFNFFLAAIRWLRFRKPGDSTELGMTNTIADQFAKKPKLDVPVLVLFSKADMLDDTYTYQQPLAFARGYLPRLHGALMTHARWFRFDFCHTMERIGAGDQAVERPVGVLLSMEWLLQSRSRWLPRLSTITLGGGR